MVRQVQRQWLAARQQRCAASAGEALQACLDEMFGSRIAGLSDAGRATVPPAVREAAAGHAARPANEAPAPPEVPAWPRPYPVAPPSLAATAPQAMPAPEARLLRDRFVMEGTAAGGTAMETLLEVTRPGRFALRAESPTGAALQLVDMLAGPGEAAGQAGAADGRLDPLLDTGTYKLRAFAAPGATGETRLHVAPFAEAAPPATLGSGESLDGTLRTCSNAASGLWWSGSAACASRPPGVLADLRLWRDGRELVAAVAETSVIEPVPGHPLNRILLRPELEPGTCLAMAYGGPALPWADGAGARPWHLRLDATAALAEGWVSGKIGPFGSEVMRVASQADGLRLDLPEPAAATLSVAAGDDGPVTAEIARDSREPAVTLRPGWRGQAARVVELRGAEGRPFQLRAFGGGNVARVSEPGRFLVAADMPGYGGDGPPATALLLRGERGRPDAVAGGVAPRMAPGLAWRSRFNLRGPAALLLEVTAPGPVAVRARGVVLRATLQPLAGGPPPAAANGEASGPPAAPGLHRRCGTGRSAAARAGPGGIRPPGRTDAAVPVAREHRTGAEA
ncbi:MAG: hypothetical protein JWP20_817 [Roseomonas sp.]|nr:hypothetical protein [Roseomonas sp.]